MLTFLLPLLTNKYLWAALAALALVIGIYTAGHRAGANSVQLKWDHAISVSIATAQTEVARQARVVTEIEVQYVDRIHTVEKRGATIVKEVPVYVTEKASSACPIPAGFVMLHNASASDTPLAGPPADADAPADGIALVDVAAVVTDNYTTCHVLAEQVSGWQAFYTKLQGR